MKLKIKKVREGVITPTRAYEGDAGLDLYVSKVDMTAPDMVKYFLGVAVEIPTGYVGVLCSRSSTFKKRHVLTNGVGIIDSGYRGEIMAICQVDPRSLLYKPGEKAFQLILVPFIAPEIEEVENLSDSERGEGGYGSSDNK